MAADEAFVANFGAGRALIQYAGWISVVAPTADHAFATFLFTGGSLIRNASR